MPYTPLIIVTALAAAIGTFLTAFMANTCIAQAPGLGLNATFVFSICMQQGYTWQQALALTLVSGVIFLIVAISPLRDKIINAIPAQLKRAISVGLGLFICLVGLINSGIITANNNLLSLGELSGPALVAIIGLVFTIILTILKVKGAIFLSIVIGTLIGIPLGVTNTNISFTLDNYSIEPIFMKLSFSGLLAVGIVPFITNVISLAMCDMFDTVSTLIGCATGADMINDDGTMKDKTMSRAITADAIATCAGACLGTSTTTSYIESVTAFAIGGRTGFASIITGALFLLSCIFAPVFGIIPSAATAPALIIVGVFMMKNVLKIDFNDLEVAIPCFLTMAMIPFSYSLSTGLGFGFISWVLIKLLRGKIKEIHPLMYVLSVLFILMFVL